MDRGCTPAALAPASGFPGMKNGPERLCVPPCTPCSPAGRIPAAAVQACCGPGTGPPAVPWQPDPRALCAWHETIPAWALATQGYAGIAQSMKCLLRMRQDCQSGQHRDGYHRIGALFQRLGGSPAFRQLRTQRLVFPLIWVVPRCQTAKFSRDSGFDRQFQLCAPSLKKQFVMTGTPRPASLIQTLRHQSAQEPRDITVVQGFHQRDPAPSPSEACLARSSGGKPCRLARPVIVTVVGLQIF